MEEKDNKKALIAIIVGVMVLVVSVVGATFAYFSVTGSSSTSTAAIGATTETTGTVTLTQGTSNLYLNITADQMSKINAGNHFYSTTTNTTSISECGGRYFDTELEEYHCNTINPVVPATLATISITGGAATTRYSCTFNLSVETKNNNGNATSYAALENEDAAVMFTGILDHFEAGAWHPINESISGLTDKPIAATKTKVTQTGTVYLTGNTSTTIKGYTVFHNLNKSQNDLQGLNMNTEVKVTNLSCSVLPPSKDYSVGWFSGWENDEDNPIPASSNYSSSMRLGVVLRADDSSSSPTEACTTMNGSLICVNGNADDLRVQCDAVGGYYESGSCFESEEGIGNYCEIGETSSYCHADGNCYLPDGGDPYCEA